MKGITETFKPKLAKKNAVLTCDLEASGLLLLMKRN